MHTPSTSTSKLQLVARWSALLALSASLASASPRAQADLDILALSQQPIAGSTSPLLGVAELSLGADSSWAATGRITSALGNPEFVIVGDPSPDGSVGAAVLRVPSATTSPPTLRLGRPDILGGQLAYLGTNELTPIVRYDSAWLDGQLLAEEGDTLGASGRRWESFGSVTLRPGGKVFLRGSTSAGGAIFAHHTDSLVLFSGGGTAAGSILRIQRFEISPNGEHWVARVVLTLGRQALIVDGDLLDIGGTGAIETQPVGAALGLGASTWSSFGAMAVDDTGRVTVQAEVQGDSSGGLTIRGDRVIQPLTTQPPFLQFRGNTFGSLAVASNGDAVYLEGEPIIGGAATLDADGDGFADAGYALGANTIGNADWVPLGSSDGFVGTVFVDVPNQAGSEQAVVRFQRSLQGTDVCDGVVNSTGRPSQLEAFGRPGAGANDLTLYCIDLPSGCVGYAIASQEAGFTSNPGGSDGNLCLGRSIGRAIDRMFTVGGPGRGSVALDLTALPQPMGTLAATSGDIWFFQVWHRDSCATGATSNFTGAVSVQFTN